MKGQANVPVTHFLAPVQLTRSLAENIRKASGISPIVQGAFDFTRPITGKTPIGLTLDVSNYFLSNFFGLSQFGVLHFGHTRGRSKPPGSLFPCGNHSCPHRQRAPRSITTPISFPFSFSFPMPHLHQKKPRLFTLNLY